jgi:hypothetical protein
MPIIKYCGVNQDRVIVGGRFFYNDRRHHQTEFGDFVDKKFVDENLETLTRLNFIIHEFDDKTEKALFRKYDKEQKESSLNRTEAQRRYDMYRLTIAESENEIDAICIPYKKDAAFMDMAKSIRKEVREREKETAERSRVIKEIFKCEKTVEVDKIVRQHKGDWEIKEAGEQRKIEISKKADEMNLKRNLENIEACSTVDELEELAVKLPSLPVIMTAVDTKLEKLKEEPK